MIMKKKRAIPTYVIADVLALMNYILSYKIPVGDFLDERSLSILKMIWKDHLTYEEIGTRYDISTSRVSEIYCKLQRKIKKGFNEIFEEHNNVLELKMEVNRLSEENLILRKTFASLCFNPDKLLNRTVRLSTKLANTNISVRLLNCLKAYDIDTFWDIEQKTKNDLFRIRNLGKESMAELECIMKENNLKFRNR